MFSVIIYGRNDSHGYNLHKRAAISFNALAEVMSDPDDEILFVDYNTPDDHPTVPEAIHDTLTDKAKRHMRILRVRPEQHVHLKSKTHLVALESQSRNVALRRSNPKNRWILYTNTDMLLVPRTEGESLSDILGALPDGFYQIPRFEIPEMLWEAAFDRKDPAGNLAKLRDWSVRFHLNQVVHNFMPMKYDALGDFQAVLREDMFAIHGFDESMILGWHCDSNLAARLALYRGRVDTLMDKAFGYHCDHTRVAAANNKGRKTTMNSHDKYIWNVSSPYIPEQAETWGWPEAEIEEVRLDRDTSYERYTPGLGQVIEPATVPFTSTSVEWHLFDDLTYDLRHTLPFVCDQVLTYPKQTAIMVVGCRADFVQRFATAWRGMGFTGPVLVPQECGLTAATRGSRAAASPISSSAPISSCSSSALRPSRSTIRCGSAARRRRPTAASSRSSSACSAAPPLPKRRRAPRAARRRAASSVSTLSSTVLAVFTDYVGANINPFCSQVLAGIPLAEPVTMKEKVILKFKKRAG
jgi:hypothetical protein